MHKTLKTALVIVACGGALAGTVGTLLNNKQQVATKIYRKDPTVRTLVQVDTIHPAPLTFRTEYLGTFVPNREVQLSAQQPGIVTGVGVEEGQAVRAGALIAALNTDEAQAQLAAVEASYRDAQLNQRRYESVARESEGVSQAQVDKARLQTATSLGQLRQAQRQVALGRITAPFSGVITARNFDLGTMLSPSSPLVTLSDVSALKLQISVPEEAVQHFRRGQRLQVRTDVHPDAVYAGTVTQVAVKSDDSHQYQVQVRVPNSDRAALKGGMYGSVVETRTTPATSLAIPRKALLGRADRPQVYVVQADGRVALRDVQTGRGTDEQLEILGGLRAGEVVVTSGQADLTPGVAVAMAR